MVDVVLAIDPGREKCGVAVVSRTRGIVVKKVVAAAELVSCASAYCQDYSVTVLVMGNGTSSAEHAARIRVFLDEASKTQRTLELIDEYRTTELARIRYWQENPPRGWRRIVPLTLQVPPVPVDDYVAVLLGEKYFKNFC